MGKTSVRRNLFQNHLSKRPVPADPNNGTSGGPSQSSQSTVTESNSSAPANSMDDGEIVVKDKNGGYSLDIPVLPPMVAEGDEMEGIEGGAGTTIGLTGQSDMSGRDKESKFVHLHPLRHFKRTVDSSVIEIEASLVEIMYRNRDRQMSSEPHGKLVCLRRC